jgi:hypothetical protein
LICFVKGKKITGKRVKASSMEKQIMMKAKKRMIALTHLFFQ